MSVLSFYRRTYNDENQGEDIREGFEPTANLKSDFAIDDDDDDNDDDGAVEGSGSGSASNKKGTTSPYEDLDDDSHVWGSSSPRK